LKNKIERLSVQMSDKILGQFIGDAMPMSILYAKTIKGLMPRNVILLV
jgi:hypothetical protein